jgi:hypothetical protein
MFLYANLAVKALLGSITLRQLENEIDPQVEKFPDGLDQA